MAGYPTPSAFGALQSVESELLDMIVSFVPLVDGANDATDASPNGATIVNRNQPQTDQFVKTIAALCRAFPGLARRYGPQNESFWRAAVLRRFDFSINRDELFYLAVYEPYISYDRIRSPHTVHRDDPSVRGYPPQADWRFILDAIHDYDSSNYMFRDYVVGQNLVCWKAFHGAFFRESEYGFLSEIQRDGGNTTAIETTWPAHEDAFTLFCDLAFFRDRVAPFDKLTTYSDSPEPLAPIFMGRKHDNESLRSDTYTMLHFCDISPHFWTGLPPVSDRWSGFDHEELPEATDADTAVRTAEDADVFPLTPPLDSDGDGDATQSFATLRQFVHQSFCDWRRVHINFLKDNEDVVSPEFYIGQRRCSGRWMGFVGVSEYYSGRNSTT